jgi:ribosome-associated heat shock protein Hsp15
MRVDKFIWCVRLTKTRSQATELIKKGKVKVNDQEIKPSRDIAIGQVVSIFRNSAEFRFKVLQLLPNRVSAKLVEGYIADVTAPEEIEKFRLYQEAQKVYRSFGTGKPTKKDRRDLQDYLDWD